MNIFQNTLFTSLKQYLASTEQGRTYPFSADSAAGLGNQLRQGLQGRMYEFDQVQEEVATERRGQICLAGCQVDDLHALLAQIRQQPVIVGPRTTNPRYEGLFTLLALPNEAAVHAADQNHTTADGVAAEIQDNVTHAYGEINHAAWSEWQTTDLLSEASRADCVLYVWRAQAGWQAIDHQWCTRLRGQDVTLLPVALTDQPCTVEWAQQAEQVRRQLGIRPGLISIPPTIRENANLPLATDLAELLKQLLAICPRVAIPLAQEVVGIRPEILRRIVRQGSLLTALLGAEPVPLIDLPLQVAISWKMALQIAAVYGRPGLDYRSREMMGTLAINLLARTVSQQLLKLTPFIGWALSALVSGCSAWLLGQSLVRYYEQGKVVDLSANRQWLKQVPPYWPRAIKRQAAADAQPIETIPLTVPIVVTDEHLPSENLTGETSAAEENLAL
jgi:uncharacterized protein (DUF697 family)